MAIAQALLQRIRTREDSINAISLRRNVSWTLGGNVIYAAAQWAVLAVIAKLGTPADVGRFALGLAITAPILLFANLQLRGIQATDATDEFRFGHYGSLRFLTTIGAMLAIAGIVTIGAYDRTSSTVILLVGMAKAFDAMSDVLAGYQQRHERMDLIARALVFNGATSLVGVTAGMWATGDLRVGAVGWMFGSLLTWVPLSVTQTRRLRSEVAANESAGAPWLNWDFMVLGRLTRAAFPLGVVMLIVSLNTNLPRLVLGQTGGPEDLGVFAAVAYLIVAGGVVMNAVGQTASPRLAKHFAQGNHEAYISLVKRMIAGSALVGAAVAILMPLIGNSVLRIVYGDEFTVSKAVLAFVGLAASTGWIASMLGYAITAARRFTVQLPLFIGVLIVTVAASVLAIPDLGMLGAAIAVLMAAVAQVVGSAFVIRRLLRLGVVHVR